VATFCGGSIGLGEDGPTHQPVETLEQLRALPNLLLIRPADGNEVGSVDTPGTYTAKCSPYDTWVPVPWESPHGAESKRALGMCRTPESPSLMVCVWACGFVQVSGAYMAALMQTYTPTILALSRQNLPNLEGSSAEKTLHGAYVLQGECGPYSCRGWILGCEVSRMGRRMSEGSRGPRLLDPRVAGRAAGADPYELGVGGMHRRGGRQEVGRQESPVRWQAQAR
jgi:hypothetical protein